VTIKFNNRQNPVVYVSRSVAVAIVVIYWVDGMPWVPIGLRSDKVSSSGEWCLPCGYLDWDESGGAAAAREIYEELGLDLRDDLVEAQPWFVQTDPAGDARQNVTLRYAHERVVDELPALIPSDESTEVRWVGLDQLIQIDHAEYFRLAFGQNALIRSYLRLRQSLASSQDVKLLGYPRGGNDI
jgi:8-oxo-dGTP pyrophosphatase MutT (NUDIX family)